MTTRGHIWPPATGATRASCTSPPHRAPRVLWISVRARCRRVGVPAPWPVTAALMRPRPRRGWDSPQVNGAPRPGAILGAVYVGASLHRLALRPSCADPRSPHLRDREPNHAQRPTAGLHHARCRHGEPGAHQGWHGLATVRTITALLADLRKMPPPCKGCSNLSPVQHLAVPHKPATADGD
jgi:hypothetical protein